MIRLIFIIVLASVGLIACNIRNTTPQNGEKEEITHTEENNLLSIMTVDDQRGFSWMNDPESFSIENHSLQINAPENSDFFNDPETKNITDNAPLLYKEVTGDFIAIAHVKPDFSAVWNATNLMVYIDSTYWAKLAFENSDATGKSIVTVVTKRVSDDANGPILNDETSIWLKLIRKGDIYAMHWSKDGQHFSMARLFTLPHRKAVKVGVAAQCPAGNKATHEILYFSIEPSTVEDLRKGQ